LFFGLWSISLVAYAVLSNLKTGTYSSIEPFDRVHTRCGDIDVLPPSYNEPNWRDQIDPVTQRTYLCQLPDGKRSHPLPEGYHFFLPSASSHTYTFNGKHLVLRLINHAALRQV
jgi:hypothetical protein